MPQEELGYVELEWTCKNCGTRNPGTRKTCQNCGAAMGAQEKFDLPAQQEVIQDKEKIAVAEVGPDVTCPYCGTRNAANAKSCKQCGGDLTGAQARFKGGVLGALDTTPAPDVKCQNCGTMNPASAVKCSNCGASLKRVEPKPAPVAQSTSPRAGMNIWLIVGIIAVVALCAVGAYFLFARTSDVTGTVAGVNWERTIAIMALAPVRDADWQDRLPSDAKVLSCELKPRRFSDVQEPNSVKVCGTPYVLDQGNGTGKVVKDCQYRVSEQYCSYTTLKLTVVDTIAARGTDLNPNWPRPALASGQQEGNRSENYRVIFESGGAQYTYTPPNAAEYARFKPGSRWLLQVNGLGSIIQATPAN